MVQRTRLTEVCRLVPADDHALLANVNFILEDQFEELLPPGFRGDPRFEELFRRFGQGRGMPRGQMFVSPGTPIYEGMIIGEHNRPNDTDVNAIKEKKLSNVRNHGKDDNVMLASPRTLTIETAMDWIDADELVEVTPDAVRVRKQILQVNLRPRRSDAIEDAQSV